MADEKTIRELLRLGILSPNSRGISGFELDYHPQRGLRISTDPSNPEDGEQAIRAVQALNLGPESFQTQQPTKTPTPPSNKFRKRSFSNLLNDYLILSSEKWAKKTVVEYEKILQRFGAFLGARSIAGIKQQDINEYVLKLEKSSVGIRTRDKHIGALRGFFDYMQRTGYFPRGIALPTEGHQPLKKRDRERMSQRNGWKQFESEDLQKLFSGDNYSQLKKPHEFWLPLLALFTGARIEELCQLTVSDIEARGSVHLIKFDVDDGAVGEKGKSLKTGSSVRLIPIQPILIDIGWLIYVNAIKNLYGPSSRIFPYLREDSINGLSDVPSEAFSRYKKRVGIDSPKKVFHSFRSTLNDRLKRADVDLEARCEFIGHDINNINSRIYSRKYGPEKLAEIIFPRLNYSEIDFGQIKYDSAEMMGSLESEMRRRDRYNTHKYARVGGRPSCK